MSTFPLVDPNGLQKEIERLKRQYVYLVSLIIQECSAAQIQTITEKAVVYNKEQK